MKQFLAFLFLSSLAFGQSIIAPASTVNGVPATNLITICKTNPGSGTCGSLVTTYTTFATSVACSGSGGPLSGTGCSNPGYSDAFGNIIAFAQAGQYWCQYKASPQAIANSVPCSTGGGGGGNGLVQATNYGVLADAQSGVASTVSTSKTITCSACNFAATDVGKTVWVTNGGIDNAHQYSGSLIVAQDTIASVNSSTSITTTTQTATTSLTSQAMVWWGTDNGTTLSNAWNAAQAQCTSLQLPFGRMMTGQPQFQNLSLIPTNCQSIYFYPTVQGISEAATVLIPTPNFNFASCGTSCFIGFANTFAAHFAINGSGLSPSGCNGQTLVDVSLGILSDFTGVAWCATGTNTTGVHVVGPGAALYFGGCASFGSTNIVSDADNNEIINFIGTNVAGLLVKTGLNTHAIGSTFYTVTANAGTSLILLGDGIQGIGGSAVPASLNVSGSVTLDNTKIYAGHIVVTGTGSVVARNSVFPNDNASFPLWIQIKDGGVFIDEGLNQFGTTATAQFPSATGVQFTSGNASVATLAGTLTGVTAGNSLVILMNWAESAGSPTLTGCSDSLGNTLTQQGTTQTTGTVNGGAHFVALFTVTKNLTTGNDTVTCNLSGNATRLDLIGFEMQENDQTTLFDRSTIVSGSTTSISSGALTLGHAADTVLFVAGTNTGFANSVTWSGLALQYPNGSSWAGLNYAWDYNLWQNSGASYTITGTWATVTDWVGWELEMRPRSNNGVPAFTQQISSAQARLFPAGVAYTSGWGSSPGTVVITPNSNSSRAQFTLTTGTTASANPVFTVTFPSAFQVPPQCTAQQIGGTQAVSTVTTGTVTTTTAAFTWNGTPGNGSTLIFQVGCN